MNEKRKDWVKIHNALALVLAAQNYDEEHEVSVILLNKKQMDAVHDAMIACNKNEVINN